MKKSILNIAAVAAIVLVSFTSCDKKAAAGSDATTDSTAVDSTATDSTATDSTAVKTDSTAVKTDSAK